MTNSYDQAQRTMNGVTLEGGREGGGEEEEEGGEEREREIEIERDWETETERTTYQPFTKLPVLWIVDIVTGVADGANVFCPINL